jgi:alkylation response protein AidB-like acyl-CoA dehydrogenase
MADYAGQREQFGSPIGSFQMVQAMLADSAIEINRSRLLLHRAAAALDAGEDYRSWISMVKVDAAEMLGRVADRAVQVFGGTGYTHGFPVERMYRDARIFRIFDGTSEIHRNGRRRRRAQGRREDLGYRGIGKGQLVCRATSSARSPRPWHSSPTARPSGSSGAAAVCKRPVPCSPRSSVGSSRRVTPPG